MFIISVPGRPFQPNLMFVSKAEAYLSKAPFTNSTLLALPTNIILGCERSTRDKHSSLLQTFINCICQRLYDIGLNYKPFCGRNK